MPHFSDIQLAFQENMRRFAAEKVAPLAERIETEDRIPTQLLEWFGDLGILQLLVPESYGGPGGDFTLACIAREEIGRVSAAAGMLAAQNSIGLVLPLLHFGTQAQRQRYLPELANGRTVTAVGITEPDAGSDVASMRSKAVREGDDWILSGQKCYITQGSLAKYILFFAKTGEVTRRGYDNISAFIVPADAPGLRIGPNEKKMGLNGVPNNTAFLDDVRVPDVDRVGREGGGFLQAMKILDMNRPVIAAMAVGTAQGALDLAVAYARERRQFGKAIGEFQGLQFMLADMAMQVEAARQLVYDVARKIDAGEHADLAASSAMAKCFATDMAMRVTTDAVQVFGGLGYMKSCPVERMMRDAKVYQIFEGTNQIQRTVIGRALLKG
jgi:alkylation response protein AidB-like acyl-CoA dehydrogenase